MNKRPFSPEQGRRAIELAERFGIDKDRILFFNEADPLDPWFPPDELLSIARREQSFLEIDISFHQWVPGLDLVCYQATVINNENRIFKMTGVAKMGEARPGGPDEHTIATGRALGAVLRAAGFHPLKSGSVVGTVASQPPSITYADEATIRTNQLAQIHILAEKAGMILEGTGDRKDMSRYRAWLTEIFGTPTAAALTETERAQAIAELRSLAGEAGNQKIDREARVSQ
jgi:hypothetical protein